MRTLSLRARQRGFTLLEVLVAVFVLSIGLLGIGGLQLTTKRTNYEAVQRTNATLLAQELLERIRTNSKQLTVYTAAGAGRTIALTSADGITATDCTGASCAANELAMYDLYEFSQAMRGVAEKSGVVNTGGLVRPTVCITGPAARPGFVNISVAWRGATKLSNPGIDACGADSGRYDDDTTNSDVYRRILLVNTYVD
jgi:type IV pilus assembly protein PilV